MPKPTFFNLPDHKRQRIIDLAIEEFAAHPYRQASISHIVARAGIAKGSLYQYFEDKLELYRWLVVDVANAQLDAYVASQSIPADADMFTQLRLVCLANMRFYRDQPRMARLAASLLDAGNDPEVSTILAASRNRIKDRLRELIVYAQSVGTLRAELDPDIAAQVMIAVLGDGLTNIMLNRLNTDLFTVLAYPERLPELPPELVDDLVGQTLSILRYGMGASLPEAEATKAPGSATRPPDSALNSLPMVADTGAIKAEHFTLNESKEVHEMTTELIYKICHDDEWHHAMSTGAFTGSAIDVQDGFIHLSDASQVKETARRYFTGRPGLVLVAVDPRPLGESLKWEPSRGGALFPHIYGVLPTLAAKWVKPLPLAEDGTPLFPDGF